MKGAQVYDKKYISELQEDKVTGGRSQCFQRRGKIYMVLNNPNTWEINGKLYLLGVDGIQELRITPAELLCLPAALANMWMCMTSIFYSHQSLDHE